jgi:hydroxyacylglutathione hydrolase
MYIERITSEGLSHHSYFISKGDQAVVIDPKRDIDTYLELEKRHQCKISKILETHRNEDYVVGSKALQNFTEADILHGQQLDFAYGTPVKADDFFEVDNLRFSVVETPGHTPESLTFTLSDLDFSQSPLMAFVGDSLFVGDTGRTDLWGEEHEAAGTLYDSLVNKILPLGDHALLYPAHGGGSVCGGAIAERNQSTIGYERRFNPKLAAADREKFIAMKAKEQHVQPPYFKRMEDWNKRGSAPIFQLPPMLEPLSAGAVNERVSQGQKVIDLRTPQAFAAAHIPGSINVWLAGLSGYFGWFAPLDESVTVVLPERASLDSVSRQIHRLGFDNVSGFLKGGFETWQNENHELHSFQSIDTSQVAKLMQRDDVQILDVRKPGEWAEGSIEDSRKIFVGDLPTRLSDLDKSTRYICMCSVGHRGGIAASILSRAGFPHVYNYLGGYTAWQKRHNQSRRAA